jgi:hypothetical protein
MYNMEWIRHLRCLVQYRLIQYISILYITLYNNLLLYNNIMTIDQIQMSLKLYNWQFIWQYGDDSKEMYCLMWSLSNWHYKVNKLGKLISINLFVYNWLKLKQMNLISFKFFMNLDFFFQNEIKYIKYYFGSNRSFYH